MEYRILIVSEDATERGRYAETLISLPPAENVSYQIATVGSVAAAQLQATRQRFDLVIVALSQHDDGLQLSSRLRELFPSMRLLLLCEQGVTKSQLKTARLIRASVAESTIDPNSLRAIVSDMLGTSGMHKEPEPENKANTNGVTPNPPKPSSGLAADVLQPFFDPFLDELRRQTNAQIAIIADKVGHILGQNGEDKDVDVTSIAAIIVRSVSESLKLGHVLRDPETIHLTVHEGKYYDVYSANVGNDRFLALFFNKEFTSPKLGLVWLVMKRSAEKFRRMQ
jgi:CheY-like chemotaxis protein